MKRSEFKRPTLEEIRAKAVNSPPRPRKPLKATATRLSRSGSLGAREASKGYIRATGRKRAKRPKMPSRKSLVRKADNLVSQYVQLRDGACVECGSTENLSNGHVLGRRSFATRFDITPDGDCHTQCWGDNYKAARTASVSYHAWYVRKFGAEAFEALYLRWQGGKKWSRLELIALCAELQIKLKDLQQERGSNAD